MHSLDVRLHSIAHHYTCLGDHNEAFNHYKLASEKGHIESRFALAKMHQKGEVIIEDVAEAMNIYMQILENGEVWYRQRSIKAIRDLYLERGNNVEALRWCKRGADEAFADDVISEEHLSFLLDVARMYQGWDPRDKNIALKGDGIEIDFVEAAKYYKMACELFGDDPESCIHNSAQYHPHHRGGKCYVTVPTLVGVSVKCNVKSIGEKLTHSETALSASFFIYKPE